MTAVDNDVSQAELKAPSRHGEAVFWPSRSAAAEVLERNLALRESHCDCQARRDLLHAALDYTTRYRDVDASLKELSPSAPILLAGHQPQLFHCGVWMKNFVLSHWGRQFHAWAVNLVIDNDTCRQNSLRVPTGSLEQPLMDAVPLDAPSAEIPYEERTILDFDCFASFGQRVTQAIQPFIQDPLIADWWPQVVEAARERGGNLGQATAQARHQLEGEWGATTLELPLSAICQMPSFRQFALSILEDAPRFKAIYNEVLHEYRRRHHLRSRSHPAPDLAREGDFYEAPFWIWTKHDPRRRRLFVRRQGDDLQLTDRAAWQVRLEGGLANRERAIEQLCEQGGLLAAAGAKLRSRALMTTMYARMTLSDLFLHGIGGAKYDELTDTLIRRFFDRTPPAYMAATATAHLPIERPNVSPDDLRRVDRQLRELRFHAEQHVDGSADGASQLVAEKRGWIAESSPQRLAERHRQIQRINSALQPLVEPQRQRLLAERQELSDALRRRKLLGSREFAFCLFPEATLRPLISTWLPD